MRLSTAQEIKREKLEIVDTVVADDINKLPDYSIAEAMQRITGVQVARDRGEGSALQGFYAANNALNTGITIRGLPMVETLFNGREVFTAGGGRTFNFADIPADMVSAISVYKTSSASQVEGGVGGLVDLRTRHPFDFSGRNVVVSGRLMNGSLADKAQPQISLLASDRWDTSFGEFGALLNVGYQKRSYREEYATSNTTTVNGQSLPSSWTQVTNIGERERMGVSIILQWRPTDKLELYAELHQTQFKTIEDATQLAVTQTSTANASNIVLFPGTNNASSVTWDNATVSTTGQSRDTIDRNTQVAVGGSWVGDALTLNTDLSYTHSYNNLTYSALNLSGATVTGFTHNVAGSPASAHLTSGNLLSLSNFTTASSWYAAVPFEGEMTALQFDGEYQLSGKVIDALSAGVRYAERKADDKLGQISDFPSVSGANAANALLVNNSPDLGGYLVGNSALTRNVVALRQLLGISAALPSSNPLGTWNIEENTKSAYLMAKLKLADLPLDGNVGVRVVRTDEFLQGYQGVSNATALPLNIDRSDIDTMPSINLRYELMPGLYLRGAASKTVTRPDFNKMSPSLTLNPGKVPPIGGAGNPNLHPMRADNYDVALEKYFNKTTSVYLTGFKKNVDGFISDVTTPETYGGITYDVTRPYNTGTSVIRGAEVGYQQFYDFLPGWLSGLGLQANYTYVDSDVQGSSLPLAGLSQNSYNIIGMYEKGPISVRVAYNWRDKYLTSISSGIPVYMDAYGWLDASVGYRFTDKISITIEGANLLGTKRNSYYGVETRPQTTWVNDTQVSATVTAHF
ncbi:vitamin B12 transporter BtuB [mine drainage metagenome]|uniref:Vitamin B12 transporter BtuB n=1 Tax=mine drainage metagenome TaxID=410659 RepID=A0A1J5QW46_9ZZZZ